MPQGNTTTGETVGSICNSCGNFLSAGNFEPGKHSCKSCSHCCATCGYPYDKSEPYATDKVCGDCAPKPVCAHCGKNIKGEVICETAAFHDGRSVCEPCYNEFSASREMTEDDIECILIEALNDYDSAENDPEIDEVQSFKQAELMTRDRGVVLKIGKQEFQITIVQC